MSERVPVSDVFAAVVPARLYGADEEAITAEMNALAKAYIVRQYVGQPGLQALEIRKIDMVVTVDPGRIEQFQPAHDCATCRAGNDQAKAHLREHPDQPIVLANL